MRADLSAAGRPLKEDGLMTVDNQDLPAPVRELRRQLSLSREYLARGFGISFATVNRWENGQVKPSKLAKAQFDSFCAKMVSQGKLKLPASSAYRSGGKK